jgi:broad specificity phosphatase PhoE
MSLLWLIRHGQAGARDDYDRLSELGREQAALLGAHLGAEGVRFHRVVTGALRRQRETAQLAIEAMRKAGAACPDPEVDARWNEFDLDAVYAGLAPRLALDDAAFGAHYARLRESIANGEPHLHRQWTPADTAIVRAWIEGRYAYEGESWLEFNRRVLAAGDELLASMDGDVNVAVFTSATPAGITLRRTAPLEPLHVLRLAGAALNTSMTLLDFREGAPHLFCFNTTPHLPRRALRTFR